jgi:hypothetical protein
VKPREREAAAHFTRATMLKNIHFSDGSKSIFREPQRAYCPAKLRPRKPGTLAALWRLIASSKLGAIDWQR